MARALSQSIRAAQLMWERWALSRYIMGERCCLQIWHNRDPCLERSAKSAMSDMNDPQATSIQRQAVIRLETARLVLRDWTPADLPDLIEGLNDLSVSRWLAFVPHPYTRAA